MVTRSQRDGESLGAISGRILLPHGPPSRVYKFREIDRKAEDIITRCRLWGATAPTLNDPFDCRPILRVGRNHTEEQKAVRGVSRRLRPHLSNKAQRTHADWLLIQMRTNPKQLEEVHDYALRDFGICSTSGESAVSDPVVWSHYAAGHAGIAIEVRDPVSAFEPGRVLVTEVHYSSTNERPVLYLADHICGNQERSCRAMRASFGFKSADWEYEREYRLVGRKSPDQYLPFDPKHLTAVVLGARVDAKREEQVMSWIAKSPAEPKVRRARLHDVNCEIVVD